MTIYHGCHEGDDIPLSGSSYSNRDFDSESGRSLFHADTTAGVLQEIALNCGTKVSGNICVCNIIVRWHCCIMHGL